MQNESSETIDLEKIFPDMTPVKKAPTMYTINGIGTSIYGKRDFHPETKTYLKTYCFTILFVPVIAIRAYRVCNAQGGGWHFFGREPLSGFAKGWNYLLLILLATVIGLGVLDNYKSSPNYRVQESLSRADAHMEENDVPNALRDYIQASNTYGCDKEYIDKAKQEIAEIQNNLTNLSVQTANEVIRAVIERSRYKKDHSKWYTQAMKLVRNKLASEPLDTYRLYKKANELQAKNKKYDGKLHLSILESVVRNNPQEIEIASELAGMYEQQKRWDDIVALLKPYGKKIVPYEGARILGQLYARQGMLQESDTLLFPYVQRGIKSLKSIEKRYDRVWQSSRKEAIRIMNLRYRHDRTTPEDKLRKIYLEYINEHTAKDKNVQAALNEYREALNVVNVAMDLGLVKLYLARGQKNQKAREEALKEVEKLFLSIQNVAGRSDRYQLTLGQVYYWMGKKDKGKEQFNEFLKQNKAQAVKVLDLAEIYRELGDSAEAYSLAEEAYNTSTKASEKQAAAEVCALATLDSKKKISWLQKSDLTNPSNAAMLSNSLGNQSLKDGKYEEAKKHLQKAVASYKKQQRTASTINNEALAHYSLFSTDSDVKHLNNASKLLEEAMSLSPNSSIIIRNAYSYMMQKSICDVVGDKVNLKLFKSNLSEALLRFFYKDTPSKKALLAKINANKTFQKSVAYMKKSMVLSPEDLDTYAKALSVYLLLDDAEGMNTLLTQLRSIAKFLPQQSYKNAPLNEYINFFQEEASYYNSLTVKNKDATTRAIAYSYQLHYLFALAKSGAKVNENEVIKIAQYTYLKYPSIKSKDNLLRARLLQVHSSLLQNKQYMAVNKSYLKNLAPEYLLVVAAKKDSQLKSKMMANPNFKQAITILKKYVKSFPNTTNILYWNILSVAGQPEAQIILQNIQKSRLLRATQEVEMILQPVNIASMLKGYWYYNAIGSKERAVQITNEFQKRGVPFHK